jgi:hypothetical protein
MPDGGAGKDIAEQTGARAPSQAATALDAVFLNQPLIPSSLPAD